MDFSNIIPIPLPTPKTTEVANGSAVSMKEEITLSFRLDKGKNNLNPSKFYVLPNPNIQAILGMRFLAENDAIINLKEGFISLDGFEYEIELGKIENNLDQEIIEKSCSIRNYENEIFDLIKQIKKTTLSVENSECLP